MSAIPQISPIQQADALLAQVIDAYTSISEDIQNCDHPNLLTLGSLKGRINELAQVSLTDPEINNQFQARIRRCSQILQAIKMQHLIAAHPEQMRICEIHILKPSSRQERRCLNLGSIIAFALDMVSSVSSFFFHSSNSSSSTSESSIYLSRV